MKKLLLITMMVASVAAQAQKKYGIVAVGGKFEFAAPFIDYASVGVIDYETNEYTEMDQIMVQSVQKLALTSDVDPTIFLAAENSIIAYSFDESSFNRSGEVSFPGIKTIAANDDYLVAGKWFGEGNYVVVYDALDMTELYVNTTINTEINDLLILEDTLVAVAYNTKGTVNPCEELGWECFADSIGYVDIIDMKNQETISTVVLGENGAGKITLSPSSLSLPSLTHPQRDFIACSETNQSLIYVNDNFEVASTRLNSGFKKVINEDESSELTIGVTSTDSLRHIIYSIGIETGDIFIGASSKSAFQKASAKNVYTNDEVVFLDTDFATYGNVLINNGTDTVEVGISTEDYLVAEFGVTGIFDAFTESNSLQTAYFASDLNDLNLTDVAIYTTSGNELMRLESTNDFNVSSLEQGVYILKATKEASIVTFRVLKQ